MSAQNSLNTITGSLVGGALAMGKLLENDKDEKNVSMPNTKEEKGIDIKMAQKARKSYQQKINAIYANKEISAKAKTRRIGKLLDEYQGGGE